MKNLLQNNIYLALKKNLFSLKNFYEIKEGSLLKFLQLVYFKAFKHIKLCEVFINFIIKTLFY